MLNGQCSWIYGEASYRGKRLTLAELSVEEMDILKINDDDDDVESKMGTSLIFRLSIEWEQPINCQLSKL